MANLLDYKQEENYTSPLRIGVIIGILITFATLIMYIGLSIDSLKNYFSIVNSFGFNNVMITLSAVSIFLGMIYSVFTGPRDTPYTNMFISAFVASEIFYCFLWGLSIFNVGLSGDIWSVLWQFLIGHMYVIVIVLIAFAMWLFIGPVRAYQDFKKEQKLRDFKNNPNG